MRYSFDSEENYCYHDGISEVDNGSTDVDNIDE